MEVESGRSKSKLAGAMMCLWNMLTLSKRSGVRVGQPAIRSSIRLARLGSRREEPGGWKHREMCSGPCKYGVRNTFL